MNPEIATACLWAAWVVSWWAAALWRDRAIRRASAGREVAYRLVIAAGALLLFNALAQGAAAWTPWTIWVLAPAGRWTMVALVAGGLLFTWWARVYLGPLWSSGIGRKAHHYVVDTGPYALVRHPIYTGVIIAETATAVQGGSVQALAGAALMFVGWYVKARMEESFLREQLGRDEYDAYARRVPMLVPFFRA